MSRFFLSLLTLLNVVFFVTGVMFGLDYGRHKVTMHTLDVRKECIDRLQIEADNNLFLGQYNLENEQITPETMGLIVRGALYDCMEESK